ncbi:MAG TPA: hypothetical protein VJH75_01785 [Patescibacteria group bacterium]|nr:hypothetical protein [Patescibacteria group bacterium]
MKNKVKELAAIIGLALVAYLLLKYYTNLGLALVFLLLYFGLTGRWYRDFLLTVFSFEKKGTTWVLSGFLSLFVFSFLSSPFILWFRYAALEISLAFLLNGLLAWYLKTCVVKGVQVVEKEEAAVVSTAWQFMPGRLIGFYIYIIIFGLGLYLLQSKISSDTILSPWQVIREEYIYIYALATFVLGLNIFSKLSSRWILLLLVLQTLLTVSYLPLTHVLIYGADGWRHMATEAQLMESGRIALKDFGSGFNALVNALNPGRFSYAWFWGLGVVIAKLTGATLIEVNKWLGPVLWAGGFPVLLFTLFKTWFKQERLSLLLVWFSSIFFALQVGGAFTLPVNTGFLFFLILLYLLTKHLENPLPGQKWFLGLLGFLSLFGYFIYFVLFFLAWGIVVLTKKPKVSCRQIVLMALGGGLVIPFLEWLFNYSNIGKINFLGKIQQLVGNFTGFYFATGPRPHDILTGNILFNQTPSYAYVGNFLLQNKWWLVIIAIVVWGLVFYGVVTYFKKQTNIWIGILFLAVFTSLIIGRYFLSGEQILSRRLDLVFALGAVFYLGWTIQWMLARWKIEEKVATRLGTILLILIFSLTITASYTLGPDTKTVSSYEYLEMDRVWEQEKDKEYHCVIADTYPLLALEAISAKGIVGGGFPMNAYFAQPERVEIVEKAKKSSGFLSDEDLARAKEVTGAEKCYFSKGLFSGDMVWDGWW